MTKHKVLLREESLFAGGRKAKIREDVSMGLMFTTWTVNAYAEGYDVTFSSAIYIHHPAWVDAVGASLSKQALAMESKQNA
jgi:hypothetical protein